MELQILSVSQLNQFLKGKLDRDPLLQNLCLRGEISNYKVYPSGHHYFSLKDAESSLRCVMFRSSALSLRFHPENGMAVLAVGRIAVYPRDGVYQLYCSHLVPEGAGDLHTAFEQCKQKLAQEGLFDPAHKKPLPAYPHRIGIVTSPAGAAVHDMLRILGARYPLSKVLLLPVRVQGEQAAGEIAAAIDYANAVSLCDVLIVGRGGGSLEDLWAFNEEPVARAIYRSVIPVVSAVGHEPDITISDYVADVRASTPSNAAELVAPDRAELADALRAAQRRMEQALARQLTEARRRLSAAAASGVLERPEELFQDRRQRLDLLSDRLLQTQRSILTRKRGDFLRLAATLDALGPFRVLRRGYSITRDQSRQPVRSVRQVHPGDRLQILLPDGVIDAVAEQIKEEAYEESFKDL